MAKKYRKKEGTIRVVQWTGKNLAEIRKFLPEPHFYQGDEIYVDTLDKKRETCVPGMYIAEYNDEVNGIHYRVYSKEYFESNYEEAK